MNLPPDFAATLSACETEQLYEMLANKDDYLPEAIAAARAELHSRHPPPETRRQMQHTAAAKIAAEKHLQNLPLKPFQKFLLFIGSGGLLFLVIIAYFSAKGQTRRVRESWPWVGLGLSFWVSLGLLWASLGSFGVAVVLSFGVTSGLYYMLLRPSAQEQESQQALSSISSRAMHGAGSDCVSCRTPLPAGARLCPHCGWTQPGQSNLRANS